MIHRRILNLMAEIKKALPPMEYVKIEEIQVSLLQPKNGGSHVLHTLNY